MWAECPRCCRELQRQLGTPAAGRTSSRFSVAWGAALRCLGAIEPLCGPESRKSSSRSAWPHVSPDPTRQPDGCGAHPQPSSPGTRRRAVAKLKPLLWPLRQQDDSHGIVARSWPPRMTFVGDRMTCVQPTHGQESMSISLQLRQHHRRAHAISLTKSDQAVNEHQPSGFAGGAGHRGRPDNH